MNLFSGVKNYLRKNEFFRNVLTLMSGTGLAQLIVILASPVVTRLYVPQDFGVLASYTVLVGLLSVLICGRYEFAIVLPKKDQDAANIVVLCVGILVATSLVILLGVIIGREWVAGFFNIPELEFWLWLLPISIVLAGLYSTFDYWQLRRKKFKKIGIAQVGGTTSTSAGNILLGLTGNPGAGGLVGASIFGRLISLIILVGGMLKDQIGYFHRNLSWSKISEMARQYKKFPIYSIWPSFLNNLSSALPVLFFTKFFDTAVTGYFSLGLRIIQLPSTFMSSSISRVFHQKIASAQAEKGEIAFYVEQVFQKLVLIAIPFMLVMLTAPYWFAFIFGENWRMAGLYTMILAPSVALKFTVSPISVVFGVRNKQDLVAAWKSLSAVSTAVFLGASLPFANAIYSLCFLALSDIILYLIYLFLIFRVSDASLLKVFSRVKIT